MGNTVLRQDRFHGDTLSKDMGDTSKASRESARDALERDDAHEAAKGFLRGLDAR